MTDIIMSVFSVFAVLFAFWWLYMRFQTAMNFHDALVRAETINEMDKKKAVL